MVHSGLELPTGMSFELPTVPRDSPYSSCVSIAYLTLTFKYCKRQNQSITIRIATSTPIDRKRLGQVCSSCKAQLLQLLCLIAFIIDLLLDDDW